MKNIYCNAKRIKEQLDDYVMGQEKGTKAISMAIAQHLQQSLNRSQLPDDLAQTDNVLIVGPTGCGKTETFRVLKRLEKDFQCPVLMFNILDYSATKTWQGVAITKIFDEVLNRAIEIYNYCDHEDASEEDEINGIEEIANRAIIVLDEFDKIALSGDGKSRQFLKEYQSNLLKLLEGNTYDMGPYTLSHKDIDDDDIGNITLDSTNMQFVLMGAFDGLEQITRWRLHQEWLVKQRKNNPTYTERSDYQNTNLGFLVNPQKTETPNKEEYTYEQLIPSQEDLVCYGIMRELIGRIPIRTVYKPLGESALVDIMVNSRTSAYRKYQQRFRQNGHELRCDRSALRKIANTAVTRGTGARGLMNAFAELLQDTQFELSGDERNLHCLLRGRDIREHKPPLIHDLTERIKAKRIKRDQRELVGRLVTDLQTIKGKKPEQTLPHKKKKTFPGKDKSRPIVRGGIIFIFCQRLVAFLISSFMSTKSLMLSYRVTSSEEISSSFNSSPSFFSSFCSIMNSLTAISSLDNC